MRSLALDPLIIKELGGLSRRGWTYLVRTLYVVITALLVYGVAGPAVTGGRAVFTSEFAELGRRLFHAFTTLQMFFLPLASAIAASDMLHSEARRGTLSLLLLTPMRPSGIVFGKWKAVMLYTGTLALGGLPVLAIAAYLGGVGPVDLLWSVALSLAMAGVTAAMALCYSVRDRTVVEAALRAYLMLHLSVIPYSFAGGILSIFFGQYGFGLSAWLHPHMAWAAAANPAQSGTFASWGWVGATLFTGYWCRRYLLQAAQPLVLTRDGSRFLDGAAQGGPPRNEDSHAAVRPGPLWEDWPLLWKECATRTVRLPNSMRVVLGILFSLLTLVAILNRPEGAAVQLAVLCPIALILAVAIGAGHFAREKERRGFEMLLSAPVSAGRIVAAKLVSGVFGMEVLMLAAFIVVGFLSLRSRKVPEELPLTVGSFLVFSYVLASALSLRSSSYRTAFLGAAGVIVFLLIGVPVVASLLETSPLARTREFWFAVRVLNPLRSLEADPFSWDRDLWVPVQLAVYGTASAALAAGMALRLRALAGGR